MAQLGISANDAGDPGLSVLAREESNKALGAGGASDRFFRGLRGLLIVWVLADHWMPLELRRLYGRRFNVDTVRTDTERRHSPEAGPSSARRA